MCFSSIYNQLSSKTISIDYTQLWKWSKLIKTEYKFEDISHRLSQDIQFYQQKYQLKEESIISFFQCINDEKVQITKDKYCDFLRLSIIFKVTIFHKLLQKYSKNHINDVDFILNKMIDHLSFQNNKDIITDEFSPKIEDCLSNNINICFQNPKFGKLPIETVYRIIEKSNEMSSEKLLDFIKESLSERYVLLHFLNIRELSKEKFNDLCDIVLNQEDSIVKKNHLFLPLDLNYLKFLKEENEAKSNQIDELNENNRVLTQEKIQLRTKNEQKTNQINQLNDTNRDLLQTIEQLRSEISQKTQQINQLNENNRELAQEKIQLRIENEQKTNQINQLNDTNRDLLQTIEQLRSEISQKSQQIDELNENNRELTQEKIQLRTDNEQKTNQINQLNEGNGDLIQEKEQLRRENEQKSKQIIQLNESNEKLKLQINAFVDLIKKLMNDVDVDSENRPRIKNIICPLAAKIGNAENVKQLISINAIDINSKYVLFLFFDVYIFFSL